MSGRLTHRALTLAAKPSRSPYSPDRPRPRIELLGHRDRLTDAELLAIKLEAAAFCAVVDFELARRGGAP